MKNSKNIGLIAAGRIGKMYAALVERTPGLFLKTVIDRYETTESLASQGITAQLVSKELNVLLDDPDIDKVIVAASTPSHEMLCHKLIEAGKHVLCEKPVSSDPQVIIEIGEKAKEKGIIVQVGYVRRFDPHYNELKQLLNKGGAGDVHMIKIVNRDPERPPFEFAKKSGGIFLDFLVHDFDMLAYLTGQKITKVYAEAEVNVDKRLGEIGDFDTVLITVKMSGGIIACIDCSRETGYGYDQRIEVFGSGGCLRAENVPLHQIVGYSKSGVSAALPRWDFKERYREAFANQLEAFLTSVSNNTPAQVGCEDAAHNVKVASACILSKKEDRPVYI